MLQGEDDDDDDDDDEGGDEAQRAGCRCRTHASSRRTLSQRQIWISSQHLLSIELGLLMFLRHVCAPHGRE